jgi:uncharacterized protein YjiK
MKPGAALVLALTAAATAACRDTPSADAAQLRSVQHERQQELARRLKAADKNPMHSDAVAQWIMPRELREISGLALTPDGRLLAHDDNSGTIYVLDPRTGILLKKFFLGAGGLNGDFEGITTIGSDIYMLESNGVIYHFREGKDGSGVPFSRLDTRLGKECEFESIAFQADSGWLVMPCKRVTNKKHNDDLVIYRVRVVGADAPKISMMTIPFDQITEGTGWKGLHPTDMTIDPATGNYVMIATREMALVELTPQGQVVRAGKLPGSHEQPEGIAITPDSILIVSDEEKQSPAAITLYRWRR